MTLLHKSYYLEIILIAFLFIEEAEKYLFSWH